MKWLLGIVVAVAVIMVGFRIFFDNGSKKQEGSDITVKNIKKNKSSKSSSNSLNTDKTAAGKSSENTGESLTSEQIYNKYFANVVMTDNKHPQTNFLAFTQDSNGKINFVPSYQIASGDWFVSSSELENVKFKIKNNEIIVNGDQLDNSANSANISLPMHFLFNGSSVSVREFQGETYTVRDISLTEFESEHSKPANDNEQSEKENDQSDESESSKSNDDSNDSGIIEQMRSLIDRAGGDNGAVSDSQLSNYFKMHPEIEGEDGFGAFKTIQKAFPAIGGDAEKVNN